DQTSFIFHLRANAKFQNIAPVSGRAVVAQDVVYSFNREISEKANAANVAGIKTMTATDPTTLRIDIDGPNADFLGSLCDARNKVYGQPAAASGWVMFNLDQPEVKDPRVRLALSKAIDRQLIITNAYSGRGELDAMGLVLPGPDWQLPKDELQKAFAPAPKA